jgi:hypothetical protein
MFYMSLYIVKLEQISSFSPTILFYLQDENVMQNILLFKYHRIYYCFYLFLECLNIATLKTK